MKYEASRRGVRRKIVFAMTCALSLGVSGCRHKPVLQPLPAVMQPVEIDRPQQTDDPLIAKVPDVTTPVPVASAASKPRHARRRSAKPSAATATPQTTTEVASAEPPAPAPSPEETAIGSLSTGGDSSPRAQQEVSDLIASIEKRLKDLPAQKVEAEKSQISKIRNFQRQAQEALSSGDAEGARTLATKARLLLDDLVK